MRVEYVIWNIPSSGFERVRKGKSNKEGEVTMIAGAKGVERRGELEWEGLERVTSHGN